MTLIVRLTIRRLGYGLLVLSLLLSAGVAVAQGSGFAEALAQVVARDKALASFYQTTGYAPLWVGKGTKQKSRVRAFEAALKQAPEHALPVARYDLAGLQAQAKGARSAVELARLEAAYSTSFLAYARDVQSGVLVPSQVNSGIKRSAPRRDPVQTLVAFMKSSPKGFIRALPPQTEQYDALLDEKAKLEKLSGGRGWGSKLGTTLKPGQSGAHVSVLRARLSAMGYGKGGGNSFDESLVQAVAQFQRDHGLAPDGVVGPGTLSELNKSPEDRMAQVVAAMERARWLNLPLGKRHVLVNIPDFTARIIDNGKVTFETRSVVGKNISSHRSPEFSDVMEFIVINPTWNVPRSITVNEYLPMLKQNRNAAGHLQLLDQSGRVVSRGSVNFAAYNASNFPYRLKEPPSQGNALGTVKFMFPNQYNIYLHDTPSKSLFARETRAFSHGCIRLGDPHDFAYTLLRKQTGDPVGFFQAKLRSGRETTVRLETPVPVHIVYRTAYADGKKPFQYRRDVYGRDAAVFKALQRAGVSLRAVRG